MTLPSDIIIRLFEIKQELVELAQLANHSVEQADLSDVAISVASAIEKLEEIQEYRDNPSTDYNELWTNHQRFLESFKRSQMNWIRTEIFSMLLS